MRAHLRTLGAILFFGTLWGASEVLLGEALRNLDLPRTSVPLNVAAVLILGIAALHLRTPGTIFLVAVVAGAYRSLTAGPFWCHVLALLVLGALFDALRFVLVPAAGRPARTALLGALSAFAAHAAFGILITHVFAYRWWTQDGGARFRDYVLVSGTLAAALSAMLLPVALRLTAGRARAPAPLRTALPRALPAAVTVLLWVVGLVAV